jgi:radical SAM superfamily enzyme YgiQ (UPF0313 family)
MTTKADFTPEEWDLVREGPPTAGMVALTADKGGSFRETWAMAKSYAEARKEHGESELLDALVESKDQQIAVAPETGSDRLRRVINKNLTNDEIVDICGAVFDRGMLTVKLYLMVGLPTETYEDLEEMIVLVERVKNRMLEAGKKFGFAGKIIPSLNGFVPKPNTPLQWDAI